MGFSAKCIEIPRCRNQVGNWTKDSNLGGPHYVDGIKTRTLGDISGGVNVDREEEAPGVEGDLSGPLRWEEKLMVSLGS